MSQDPISKLAGVILIGIVVFAFMSRWELQPSNGVDDTAVIYFKLDRWTGASYECVRDSCVKGIVDEPVAESSAPPTENRFSRFAPPSEDEVDND